MAGFVGGESWFFSQSIVAFEALNNPLFNLGGATHGAIAVKCQLQGFAAGSGEPDNHTLEEGRVGTGTKLSLPRPGRIPTRRRGWTRPGRRGRAAGQRPAAGDAGDGGATTRRSARGCGPARCVWLPTSVSRTRDCGHAGDAYAIDRGLYRRRNAVERCVAGLKENRRVAIRYEMLAASQAVAMIRLCLKRIYAALSDRENVGVNPSGKSRKS
jgi:transposase